MSFSVFVSNSVGCESKSAEGVRVIRYLELNRHVIVTDVARADQVIVNPCAFVGFPTETESAFMDTLDFVPRYPPSHGMNARFSRESGTPAADLEPLPKELARDRHQRLTEVYSAAQGVVIRLDPSLVRIFGT